MNLAEVDDVGICSICDAIEDVGHAQGGRRAMGDDRARRPPDIGKNHSWSNSSGVINPFAIGRGPSRLTGVVRAQVRRSAAQRLVVDRPVAARTGLIPFLDPTVYGRSTLEGASFIVSSAYPDERFNGRTFQLRLSGMTAAFHDLAFTIVSRSPGGTSIGRCRPR